MYFDFSPPGDLIFAFLGLKKAVSSTGSNVLHPKEGGLSEISRGGSQEGGQYQRWRASKWYLLL